MDRQQHIINKQIIEFILPTKDNAQEIQESFSRVYKNFVLPVIERICNKYAGSDEVIRIDKLNIDIGRLDINNLHTDFPEKVGKKLEEILVKKIYNSRDPSNSGLADITNKNTTTDVNKTTKYINTIQTNLEKLVYFLQSGVKPWYASDKENNSILYITEELLVKSPDALKKVLHEVLQYDIPRKRLIFQFPVPLLKKILNLINPGSADFIFEFCDVLEKINHHHKIFDLSGEKLKNTMLDLAIDYVVVKQDNIIYTTGKKQFILFISNRLNDNVVNKIRKKYGNQAVIKSIREGLTFLKAKGNTADNISAGHLIHDLLTELESTEKKGPVEDFNKDTDVAIPNQEAENDVTPSTIDQSEIIKENLKNKENELDELKFEKNKEDDIILQGKENLDLKTGKKKNIVDKVKSGNKAKNKEYDELDNISKEESGPGLSEGVDSEEIQLDKEDVESKGYKNKIVAKQDYKKTNISGKPDSISASENAQKVDETSENINNTLKGAGNQPENIYDDNDPTDGQKTTLGEITREKGKEEGQHNIKQKKPGFSKLYKFNAVSIEEQYIDNAGLVLLWTFLNRFFTLLGYVKNNQFTDIEAKYRAVHILQYLVTGQEKTAEDKLILNKLLCGLDINEPVPVGIEMTGFEKEESNNLLQAVIENWEALKKTSVESLQTTFLQKEGILLKQNNGWKLNIERETVDILLNRLNWSISVIVLPWSKEIIYVEW